MELVIHLQKYVCVYVCMNIFFTSFRIKQNCRMYFKIISSVEKPIGIDIF